MADFTAGSTAYIIENNKYIREVTIVKVAGDFCTIRFADRNGGTRLRRNRLYLSKEEAEMAVRGTRAENENNNQPMTHNEKHVSGRKNQYDYMREHKL